MDGAREQEIIRDALKETPEKSNVQIANSLGVTDKTVAKQRAFLESTSEIPRLDKTIGADGKTRPRKPVSIFNPSEAEKIALKNPEMVEKASRILPTFTGHKKGKQNHSRKGTKKAVFWRFLLRAWEYLALIFSG